LVATKNGGLEPPRAPVRLPPIILLALLGPIMNGGCSTPRFLIEAENARTNTHIVLAFEETVFNKHRVHEGFDRYVSSDYKEHDAALPGGLDAVTKALDNELTDVRPNSHVVVKRTVAQGDLVAVDAVWEQGPGEKDALARVDIYRLANSRIVEHWKVEQPVTDDGLSENNGAP
jgi:predicted SnoaL-like aldol condensation-catalyzing enzyme